MEIEQKNEVKCPSRNLQENLAAEEIMKTDLRIKPSLFFKSRTYKKTVMILTT